MKTKILSVVILFTFLTTYSQKKWTLKECVDQALEKNISIQQSKLNVELAKKDVAIAKGNFLPNLNGSTGGNLNFGSGFDPVSQNRITTSIFGGSVGVSSGYTIFNGYRNTNVYKQAQLGIESSKYDLQKIENDVSLFVVNGYLNVLFAKENLNAAKVQYEISKKQIEATKSRFEAGVIAKGELLNAQSTAASDLQNVVTQENVLNIALLNLAQTLQVPTNEFDVAPIELGTPSAQLLYDNSSIIYEKSLINRPEIERAKLAIENADLNIKIAKS
ncbi:MAG: TolC family protein, partial [Polaribacter sp.]